MACTLTSNALGSITDVRAAADLAHAAGAEIFLDSVHYGPHAPLDVQAFDCDYLVCSGYKIFAPHMGFMWGRYEVLEKLPTFREEFIPDAPPGKIEAGIAYENVAGMDAAVGYLARLGRTLAARPGLPDARSLHEDARGAMEAIRGLRAAAVAGDLAGAQGLRRHDLRHRGGCTRGRARTHAICFNLPGLLPQRVTEGCARADIGIRDGHMYAPRLMDRLGVCARTPAWCVSRWCTTTRWRKSTASATCSRTCATPAER